MGCQSWLVPSVLLSLVSHTEHSLDLIELKGLDLLGNLEAVGGEGLGRDGPHHLAQVKLTWAEWEIAILVILPILTEQVRWEFSRFSGCFGDNHLTD